MNKLFVAILMLLCCTKSEKVQAQSNTPTSPTITSSLRATLQKYDVARRVSEGLAAVRDKRNGRWGFIDQMGKLVIQCKYADVFGIHYVYKEGLACVANNNYKFGFIDKQGNICIPFVYDFAYNFSDGMAMVNSNDHWGVINHDGKLIVPFIYDEVKSYAEGYAAVKKNGKWDRWCHQVK